MRILIGLLSLLISSTVGHAQTPADGTLLADAPCTIASATYDDLVAALGTRPAGDPRDTAFDEATFRRNTPARWFDALKRGKEIRCRKITYTSDGLKVTGFIVEPASPGRRPAVIFNRGGNQALGSIRSGDLIEFAGWALDGYVVFASQYRGNDGGDGKEEFGGADVNDVVHLATLARAWPSVDPEALFMYGLSRGGMMTYLAVKRGVNLRAAAVVGAPADLAAGLTYRGEMEEVYRQLMPDYANRKAEHLRQRSAALWADELRVPLLILHGGADWRVWPGESLAVATRLQALGRPYGLFVYAGDDHPLTHNWPDARARLREWFHRHLPPRPPPQD